MAIPKVTVGDDIGLPCVLRISGIAIGIDATSTIRVSITNASKTVSYTGVITLDIDDINHDLPNGLVWVVIPAAATNTMRLGKAFLEIEVQDPTQLPGKNIATWTHELTVDLTTIT